MTDYTFTNPSSRAVIGGLLTIRGIDQAQPLDVAAAWNIHQNRPRPESPSVTTVTTNTLVVHGQAVTRDINLVGLPGQIGSFKQERLDSGMGLLFSFSNQPTADATGDREFQNTGGSSAAESTAFTLALRPADPGTPPTIVDVAGDVFIDDPGGSNFISRDVTLTDPAGVQPGDLLVAYMTSRDDVLYDEASGWTTVFRFADTAGDDYNVYLAYKFVPSTGLQGNPTVRYYLDEAASGVGPTEAIDEVAAYNLPITYDGNLSYTELPTGRGIASTSVAGDHVVGRTMVGGDHALTNLFDTPELTLELVFTFQGDADDSRVFGIVDGNTVPLAFYIQNTGGGVYNTISVWNNNYNNTGFDIATREDDRIVAHLVFDVLNPTTTDHIRLYIDGVRQTMPAFTLPVVGLQIDAGDMLALLNRNTGDRSVVGTAWYGALYAEGLSDADIAANAALLLASDDP